MNAFATFGIRSALVALAATISSGSVLYAQNDLPNRSQVPLISRLETNQACEAILFAADGKTLVTYGDLSKSGNVVGFWNLATGKKIAAQPYYGNFFAISPDCSRFASICRPIDLRERHPWDLQLLGVTPEGNFKPLFDGRFGDWKGGYTWACTAAYTPDNAMVAFADHGETIHVFDATNGRELRSFKGGVAARYSPDGKELLAVRYSGGLRRIDAESGKLIGG